MVAPSLTVCAMPQSVKLRVAGAPTAVVPEGTVIATVIATVVPALPGVAGFALHFAL